MNRERSCIKVETWAGLAQDNPMINIILLLALCLPFPAQADLQKTDFTTWNHTNARDFGCFLQKSFGHKDKKFNCALKKYKNKGDPCRRLKEYAEGPAFPNEKAGEVDPRIESIDLGWEHGDLQAVNITLKDKFAEKELRESFELPASASVQDCGQKHSCIVLQNFDHMGASDTDCSGK